MRITRKQTYSALAGVGIMLGTAGLAAAATGGSSAPTDPATEPVVAAASPDDADSGVGGNEANEGPEGSEQNEADEGFEQNDGNETDEQDGSSYTSSITVADTGESNSETDEQAQLAGLATITGDDASHAALAAQPGTVTDVQLENENGNVVYSVIVDTGNGSVDVKVDAGDGSVLTTEADDGDGEAHDGTDDEQDEANEAPGTEAADD